MSIIRRVQAWWGVFAPLGLRRVFLLSRYSFALVAGLVEPSKSDFFRVKRRKAITRGLGAFEDIQSDFTNHCLYSPYFWNSTEAHDDWMSVGEVLCKNSKSCAQGCGLLFRTIDFIDFFLSTNGSIYGLNSSTHGRFFCYDLDLSYDRV